MLNIDLDYTIKVRLPIIIFTVLITYGCAFWLGTPTRKGYGYEPKQPIAFSHKLHAGDMKMDCRYCHVGVDKSRHATVPSVDTCMNCHATVKAVGRNPTKDHFNYNVHLSHKEGTLGQAVQSILDTKKKFKDENDYFKNLHSLEDPSKIKDILNDIINVKNNREKFVSTYGSFEFQEKELTDLIAKNDRTDEEDKKLVRFMMDELYKIDSYNSSEIKKLTTYFKSGEALKWKRIYRLPKYVYFNHSVHINKGIDCTNCHGNVANLDSMKKMKPITMGRCLDCHRGDYKEFHEGLEEKVVGPESCGVCHR